MEIRYSGAAPTEISIGKGAKPNFVWVNPTSSFRQMIWLGDGRVISDGRLLEMIFPIERMDFEMFSPNQTVPCFKFRVLEIADYPDLVRLWYAFSGEKDPRNNYRK